jgi:carbon-monoxide dehydrogenase medium subunit
MKASAFAYARATSVANALELLAVHGEKAKVLSGGQSLIPAMNLRLIAPELVVDIGELAELRDRVRATLVIGALTRHADLLKSPDVANHAPLLRRQWRRRPPCDPQPGAPLAAALRRRTRHRNCRPACWRCATIVRGPGGERQIAAEDFFTGIYETKLAPQDLLVAIELPIARKGSAHYFHEFARRHGDYAIVGLAAQAVLQADRFADLRLGYFAVGEKPVLAKAAGKLVGVAITPALLAEASAALSGELDPHEDQQARPRCADIRKVLLVRCVARC